VIAVASKPIKTRLDQLLVDRGLAPSREKAQALLLAGAVFVDGQPAGKPGRAVSITSKIDVTSQPRYVSRGGLKLEAALREFAIDPHDRVCLDVGASTGGFTDCLLQHGAAKVFAFDVGHSQLDWKIRTDPRVVVREGINARNLTAADTGEPVSLIVCDVSFISVTLIVPTFPSLLDDNGELVILVKPQFEAGREEVGKGGIVRDAAVHQATCQRVRQAVEALGFQAAIIDSPILGTEGNREFLLHARH
jgi:23S rRNA (cytidine1920-2'-O)/16S rRNA (cytidine1409-2'-O)-methyltransferase